MRRLTLAAAAALAGLVATPAAHAAPDVDTDLGCYPPGTRVSMTGSGFTPGATYTAALDGTTLGSGPLDDGGAFAASFPAPPLSRGALDEAHVLTVDDGAVAGRARFRVARLTAGFHPATGSPSTLRVRWHAAGFGRRGSRLWLHYVDPRGRARTTVALGRTEGPCGTLRTDRRRLFSFAPTRGTWRLQVDRRRAYRATTRPRVVRRVRVS